MNDMLHMQTKIFLETMQKKNEESLFVVYKDHYGIVCVYEHEIDREILLEELKEGLY